MRRFISLARAMLLVAMWAGNLPTASAAEPAKAGKAFQVTIDYGDGAELHLKNLAWRKQLTVLDALAAVKKHPHGVSFAFKGKGPTALVTQIGDVKNQGAGVQSRNWLFFVNGKKSDVGAGVCPVAAGDTVLWKFEVLKYDE
jgi:hypothetical protein